MGNECLNLLTYIQAREFIRSFRLEESELNDRTRKAIQSATKNGTKKGF